MFSRSFQQEQEEMNAKNYRPRDTLSEKVKALSGEKEEGKEKREEEEGGSVRERERERKYMYVVV